MNVEIPYKDVKDIYELLGTLHAYQQAEDLKASMRAQVENQWSPLTGVIEQHLKRVENILKDYAWQQQQAVEEEQVDETESSGESG